MIPFKKTWITISTRSSREEIIIPDYVLCKTIQFLPFLYTAGNLPVTRICTLKSLYIVCGEKI